MVFCFFIYFIWLEFLLIALTGCELLQCTLVNPAEHRLHHELPQQNIHLRMIIKAIF